MRKLGVALALALAACSGAPPLPKTPRGPRVLEIRGAVKHGPFALGSEDLRALPRRTVHGIDPASGKEGTWTGVAVEPLVTSRVELTRRADTVLARTASGAAVPIPLVVIRQLKPVLAYEADGKRLAAPALAWPTADAPGLATDPRAAAWWARDVVALELVQWQRTLGSALALLEGAPDGARRGAAAFADRCISCHRIRAAGGTTGPDLTAAASRMDATAFRALLRGHPGVPPPAGERDGGDVVADAWAFLGAIAASPPAEEQADAPGEDAPADRGGAGCRRR